MAHTEFLIDVHERPAGRIAVVTMDDGEGDRRPPTFGVEAMDSLEAALDAIEADGDLAGVVLTGKPGAFSAGADLRTFVGIDTDTARGAALRGHELFGRLQALDVPTLAAINGVCMGGGLEIALHCDLRTVSTEARAIAFPEVFLSLVPGWGGTQLAPRLVGARHAVEAIVVNALNTNRVMGPADALERGFADRILDAADFLEESIGLLGSVIAGTTAVDRDVDPADGLEEALEAGREVADRRTQGATLAPYRALELIEFAARGGDIGEGRRREQEALAQLLTARQAQASVYAFDLVNRRARRQVGRPEVDPRPIGRVGIIGAGLMGSQIAALHLERLGVPVVIKDVDQGALERGSEHVQAALADAARRGRIDEDRATELAGMLTTTTEYDDLAGADWVLEAVVERLEVKTAVLSELDQVLEPGAVVATNTSSLSVTAMGEALQDPSRLVGLHFFNPVAILPLVEIVRPAPASDTATATAFEVARQLGKSVVRCADAPGFVVNRLLFRFHAAAVSALRHGNTFREIDTQIRRIGVPMGPFELFGLVGLKVSHQVATSLAEAFGDRFALDENFELLGALDVPGIYDADGGGEVFPEVAAAVVVDPDAQLLDGDGIRTLALEAIAEEIGHMLADGVVDDPRDIDTALLLGAGWPFFNGGICPLLDDHGTSERVLGRRLVT